MQGEYSFSSISLITTFLGHYFGLFLVFGPWITPTASNILPTILANNGFVSKTLKQKDFQWALLNSFSLEIIKYFLTLPYNFPYNFSFGLKMYYFDLFPHFSALHFRAENGCFSFGFALFIFRFQAILYWKRAYFLGFRTFFMPILGQLKWAFPWPIQGILAWNGRRERKEKFDKRKERYRIIYICYIWRYTLLF